MEHVIAILEGFRFSKTEALVYVNLLQNGHLTGYQIAKNIGLSRSSVYNALNVLYRKGVVFMLPGESNQFRALESDILIPRLRKEYEEATTALEQALAHIEVPDIGGRFLNIEGFDNLMVKAKELLKTAEREVLINTDFDPYLFQSELEYLKAKGVRCILFSFNEMDCDELSLEIYSHGYPRKEGRMNSRLMLSIDHKMTLIGSSQSGDKGNVGNTGNRFVGTFTENTLLASIVAEHIHHDIYLLNLKKAYGKELLSEDIALQSDFEQSSCKLSPDSLNENL